MTITSRENEKLKTVRKLNARRREREHAGMFVAEGEDLVNAATVAGWEAVELLTAEGSGLAGAEVTAELLNGVAELSSGTRQLGIYRQRWHQAAVGRLHLYLHGISDPGNLGTILRSAAAFGAGSVVLGPGSADPFGPRAVRASMGAIFQVPVIKGEVPCSADAENRGEATALRAATTIALDAHAERTLAQTVPLLRGDEQITLLIGAERGGLPQDLQDSAAHVARIPIATDSLNAAMAAAVALYELTRGSRD